MDPDWQVEKFNETILNIMSNFIPNKQIRIDPKDPPWMSTHLKNMIKRQNRQYKNYKRHNYRPEDKARVDNFRSECNAAIANAKDTYFQELGKKLANKNTSQKTYWKIVNKLLNKCKAPKIPPILHENKFIVNCKAKAAAFNHFLLPNARLFKMVVYNQLSTILYHLVYILYE